MKKVFILSIFFVSLCTFFNTKCEYHFLEIILDIPFLFESPILLLHNKNNIKNKAEKKENSRAHLTRAEINSDLTVHGSIYVDRGIVSTGPVTCINGTKILNGGITSHGPININPYNGHEVTIGNISNGKSILLLTEAGSSIIVKGGDLVLQTSSIGLPDSGQYLPLTVGSDGLLKTLYSTKKVKKNISYFDQSSFDLSVINFLNPSFFEYIDTNTIQWGFIAEDFQDTPLENIVVYDEQKEIIGVDDKKILTLTVWLIKEQERKISKLEEKIDFLERLLSQKDNK